MRIKHVKAWWVRIPIETARQHRSDFGQVRTFDAAILRIETDDGIVGWGEGKNAAGSAGNYGALVHMLNHEVAPQLIGRDPRDIGPIWEMLYNGVARRPRAAAAGHAMPQIARRGMIGRRDQRASTSRCGTFSAKSLGEPVWRLLGGRKARRMPAYASGGWAKRRKDRRPAQILYRQGRLQGGEDAGRRHGRRRRTSRRRASRRRARRSVPMSTSWSMRTAPTRSPKPSASCSWCPTATSPGSRSRSSPTTRPGMAEVRASVHRCRSPPARARRRATLSAILPMLQARPTSSSRTRRSAAASARPCASAPSPAPSTCGFAPHLWAGAPCFFAGLHICAASPASFIVEYSLGANPMIHDLIEETVEVKDGMIAIPDRPGLGFTISERFLEAHAQS